MRKNPFKTSFTPDFKIDWGSCTSPKVDYPTREKKPVAIFDIREFVKKEKNKKINEMMASMGVEDNFGPSPFVKNSPLPFQDGKKNRELSVNDLVKRIDEKLAEIEKEEQEAKKKEEEKRKEIKEEKKSLEIKEAKIEEKQPLYNSMKPHGKTVTEYNKQEKIEKLDDDDLFSTSYLEKKINEKLAQMNKEEKEKKQETIKNNAEERKNEGYYKPTATIKLEDVQDDEKFFDDFFDD